LNLQFTKAEAVKRLEIQSAINAAAIVIVEDMYGQYILLGNENEVVVSAASMVTGTAATDLNGFTLTLQDVSTELPHFVEADIIAGLLP
jgi:nitrogen fixation protein